MTELRFPAVPDDAAIAALKRRGLNFVPSGHWTELWQQAHQTAFTVAQSAGFDILKDIHAALLKAMSQGQTFREFRQELTPLLQRRGWWGQDTRIDPLTGEVRAVTLGSPRRLQTIFDVNLRVSAAQGDWHRQQAVRHTRPYLRYTALLDNRTRPQHRLWHNVILPLDHPWWDSHYPPNGWRCRCKVMSVSREDLETEGWQVTANPPDEGMVPWLNPRTGETLIQPRGIDPGWAYHPGRTDAAAHTARLAMDKLADLPPRLGAQAVASLAFAFPQVEQELAGWIEGIASQAEAGTFAPGVATEEATHGDSNWLTRLPTNEIAVAIRKPAVRANGYRRATGARRVVGALDDAVLDFLQHRGITPATAAISMGDRDLLHALRTAKAAPLPVAVWKRLPSLLARPYAIYFDRQNPGLVYVLDEPEGQGKIIVLVDYKTKMARKNVLINSVRTGARIEGMREFLDETRYEKIR